MSMTLATVADALIEFILSLLRDPALSDEFDEDPQATLASNGLSGVTAEDVCAVAPIIADRPQVAPKPAPDHPMPTPPKPPGPPEPPAVHEIINIKNNLTWIDDRDTIVDQSVNQNIWAGGDVTQVFDNEAIVASGDEAIAAGDDVDASTNLDASTNIGNGAEGDVNVGNDTDTTTIEDSFNDESDNSTNTENNADVDVNESFNESTETNTTEGSNNETTVVDTTVNSAETTVSVDNSSQVAVVAESDISTESDAAVFETDDSAMTQEYVADDEF
ncbi:IniB N-terminal domain-containing protein [Microbacterium sp. NPDC077184]|uniref:IniB N-terminal domain-containing protein n=1 Tax=Microbacterium sp. NPDC077184 TaxID=3154764 RepID=UPI00343E6B2A